jgi:multidrug efflux pump subunit AcrA (membrane-fusion protein)
MRIAPLFAAPPIALGIAVAVWLISSAPGPDRIESAAPALPVRVITAASEIILPTINVWGNLRAADTWVAVAEVPGEVIWRHPDLEPGRLIPAGTKVLRIDPVDYELALAQAQADLLAFNAESAQLATEATNTARILELERERLVLAEADLERISTLAAQETISQSRADDAERATLLARRTVAELENSLALIPPREARITAQIARSEAAIARALRALEHTEIRTPFDLRVREVAAERFQTVAPGQVVVRANGIAAAEVVAHLPIDSFRGLFGDTSDTISVSEMMRAMPFTQVDVVLSPLSDPSQIWSAHISRVEGALDARARTVPVVVVVDDPYVGANPPSRLPLVPNMQVLISFEGEPLTDAVVLPETALHGGMVRVLGHGGLLELRPVSVALSQNGRIVIADGIEPGDIVVIDDIAPAIPGMALTAIEVHQ